MLFVILSTMKYCQNLTDLSKGMMLKLEPGPKVILVITLLKLYFKMTLIEMKWFIHT